MISIVSRINNTMKLIQAIKTAHAGKYIPLNIERDGKFYYWNSSADKSYQDYRKAMDVLSRHKIVRSLLKRMKII